MSVGPAPVRARSAASATTPRTASTSLPSIDCLGHRVRVGPIGEPARRVWSTPAASTRRRGCSRTRRTRELPDGGEVERLVERADVRRAVAEEAERHLIRCRDTAPRSAGRWRSAGGAPTIANEPTTPTAHVGEVHGAALAAAEPVGLAEDLAEGAVERSAHGEDRTVPAVRAGHRVAVPQRGGGADRHRLLALAEVGAAADETLGEHAMALVLEEADLVHRAQVPELGLRGSRRHPGRRRSCCAPLELAGRRPLRRLRRAGPARRAG